MMDLLRNNPLLNFLWVDKYSPLVFIFSLCLFWTIRYVKSPWRQMPPGPRGYPLVGNLFDIMTKHQWLLFTEWRNTYGDIMSLNVAGNPIIILNSQKAAADLLDRRASIYSDRPRNIGTVRQYYQTHVTEAIILASDIMHDPTQWNKHFHRTSASTIMTVLYDTKTIVQDNNTTVKEINDCVTRLTKAAMPGSYLVEFFPWMMHIPNRFAKWKREAEMWYAKDSLMFELGQRRREAELSAQLIRNKERYNLTLRENAWLAGTMFSAGAETSSVVMGWWLLAMVIYPETQKRAQAELDAVVGRSRMPSFADYEHLPYIRAMVKEALRWRPVDPLGLPHRSIEDDWYQGYFIPKGSICVVNVWSLNRDPEIYGPDAAHFNPARHLDEKGQIGPGPVDTKEEGHATYGFGRRICVGRHQARNADGKYVPIDVDGCVDAGLVVRPMPFQPKVTPRFPEAVDIVDQERELLGL
ncbi:cytochrome P450 [Infundibulicybe gibba]|nr:cytochrome P450 [Infundibulicybe gibba]